MSENSKTNHMIKLFTEQSNAKHTMMKNEMKRLSSDLDLTQELDNNDVLHDCTLDLKSFHGGHTVCNNFWNAFNEVIQEQSVAEEKRHAEHGHCSDTTCVRDWIQQAEAKFSPNAPIHSSSYVHHQLVPSCNKRNSSKHCCHRFNVQKKIQHKVIQNNDVDMHYANKNTKNVRQVVVTLFPKEHTTCISLDDKCIVKMAPPGVPLALMSKTKPAWASIDVEIKAEDHDTSIKSNLVPSVIFDIEIQEEASLGKFYQGLMHVGLKENGLYKGSCTRHAVETSVTMLDKLSNKMTLVINTDGGGDRNHRFERVMVSYLYMGVKHNLEKVIAVKTAAGGSCWNIVERCMCVLNISLYTAALNRVFTSQELEDLLKKHKGAKALMESKPSEQIIKSYGESTMPAMKEIERHLQKCNYSNKKVKIFKPATNKCIEDEMQWSHKLFPFLPSDLVNCKSDTFRRTEEGRRFMETHFQINMHTWQASKVDGRSCAWCTQMPKDVSVAKNIKGFISPPMHNETNDAFVCMPTLVEEIDLEEEHCPSKIKKGRS